MNRRGFLSSILKAGASAMILPPALTYARTWKRDGLLWKSSDKGIIHMLREAYKKEPHLYNCVLLPPVNHYILESTTFEVAIDLPVMIENFSLS